MQKPWLQQQQVQRSLPSLVSQVNHHQASLTPFAFRGDILIQIQRNFILLCLKLDFSKGLLNHKSTNIRAQFTDFGLCEIDSRGNCARSIEDVVNLRKRETRAFALAESDFERARLDGDKASWGCGRCLILRNSEGVGSRALEFEFKGPDSAFRKEDILLDITLGVASVGTIKWIRVDTYAFELDCSAKCAC